MSSRIAIWATMGTALIAACTAGAESRRPLWTGSFETGWERNWQVGKRKWGMQNLKPATEQGGQFPTFLRTTFPAGSASPTVTRTSKAPVGGGQFYTTLGLPPRDSLFLRYSVRFPEGFDFVKGGKLPGLYGGSVGSGHHIPDGENGFSTRFMWRRRGDGEVYAYLPTSKEHGTSLGRGRWQFTPGKWQMLEQFVQLNTPGQKNGSLRVWIDGKLVLEQNDLLFRTTDKLKIEGIFFSTFFGGDDTTWATPHATHVDFAAFSLLNSPPER